MSKIKVTTAFHFAEAGHTVHKISKGTYTVSDAPDWEGSVSPRCAEVALEEKWATKAGTKKTADTDSNGPDGENEGDQNQE